MLLHYLMLPMREVVKIITDAERNKLGDIEANADVTDADNVLSAGAVMTSGNQTISDVKTFSSTIQGDISGNAGTVTNGYIQQAMLQNYLMLVMREVVKS